MTLMRSDNTPPLDDIVLDLDVAGKPALLQALASRAAQRLGRDEQEVSAALLARERLGTTALGRGVALPHARLAGGDPPLMLFARLRHAIDFEARDEEPVDLVFAVLWPEESAEGFLPALSGLCRSLREPAILLGLRRAVTPAEVVALLARPG
jgi:PTS system nitrogen regulatory IIA component